MFWKVVFPLLEGFLVLSLFKRDCFALALLVTAEGIKGNVCWNFSRLTEGLDWVIVDGECHSKKS